MSLASLLASALRRREGSSADARGALDARTYRALARPLAVVYTDTADFTVRVSRDGLLHFLMALTGRPMPIARLVARRAGPSAR